MIQDLLQQNIKSMVEVRELEKQSLDKKEQEKIEKTFKAIVTNTFDNVGQIHKATKLCEFKPSSKIIMICKNLLTDLEQCLQGSISEERNSTLASKQKQLEENLKAEWNDFYQERTKVIVNLLNTVKELVPDRSKADAALIRIRNGANSLQNERTMELFIEGLKAGEQIINDMRLLEPQKRFLEKVSNGTATINDLNEDVLKWINEKELGGKLGICFNADYT